MALNIESLSTRIGKLFADKANIASYWQDIAHFCLPRKAWITSKRHEGDRLQFNRIFDNTAIRSLNIMGAGFASHLTNPSAPWFLMSTKNKDLAQGKDAKLWFKQVTDKIRITLNSTNFDSSMQEFYLDSGCFGTAVIYQEEDPEKKVRFTTIPLEEITIVEDSLGRVKEVHRKFDYTALQAWERWGAEAGPKVREAMFGVSKDVSKSITFTHSVFPRESRIAGKIDAANKPFASIWLEFESKHKILESGFDEMPYAVGRFSKRVGERWGFSPAMSALADIKMLNAEKKTLIRGAMKQVDPPIILPDSGFIYPFNMNPAGINYAKDKTASDAYKPIETKGKIQIGLEMIKDVKEDIEKAFFVPLFQAFSQITKQMTIPEVQRRIAENMVLLGPVVGRFTDEVFDPMLTRTFNILFRNGELPPPPPSLQGQELDIIYISQLALAQRAVEINSLKSFLQDVSDISAIVPSALDKIDADKVIDVLAEIKNVTPEILRGDEAVELIRQVRAEQELKLAQISQLQQGADIAKTGSEVDRNLS